MASLGNIGINFPRAPAQMGAYSFCTLDKQPVSVNMTAVSAVPFAFTSLFRNGVLNARGRCDGAGNWHFYDMDDSGAQEYVIATFTQDAYTGELWTATVTGATVVVTKLFGSQRAVAAAFT